MKPYKKNIFIYRGDYFEEWFQVCESVFNPATGKYEIGPGRDLTDWTGIFQIRETDDGPLLMEGTVVFDDQTDEATRGWVAFVLEAGQTAEVDSTWKVFDVQLTDDLGKPRTYREGGIEMDTDVSRVEP